MTQSMHSLADLVERFGGRVVGDAATRVVQVATLEGARQGEIAFLTNAKYRSQLERTRAPRPGAAT